MNRLYHTNDNIGVPVDISHTLLQAVEAAYAALDHKLCTLIAAVLKPTEIVSE